MRCQTHKINDLFVIGPSVFKLFAISGHFYAHTYVVRITYISTYLLLVQITERLDVHRKLQNSNYSPTRYDN